MGIDCKGVLRWLWPPASEWETERHWKPVRRNIVPENAAAVVRALLSVRFHPEKPTLIVDLWAKLVEAGRR